VDNQTRLATDAMVSYRFITTATLKSGIFYTPRFGRSIFFSTTMMWQQSFGPVHCKTNSQENCRTQLAQKAMLSN
jgi:hypothetical protein